MCRRTPIPANRECSARLFSPAARGRCWSGTTDRAPPGSSRRVAVAQGSSGASTRTRTWGLAVRSGALCPAELWRLEWCGNCGGKKKPPWSVPRRAAPWTGPVTRSRRGARAARTASTRVRHRPSSARCVLPCCLPSHGAVKPFPAHSPTPGRRISRLTGQQLEVRAPPTGKAEHEVQVHEVHLGTAHVPHSPRAPVRFGREPTWERQQHGLGEHGAFPVEEHHRDVEPGSFRSVTSSSTVCSPRPAAVTSTSSRSDNRTRASSGGNATVAVEVDPVTAEPDTTGAEADPPPDRSERPTRWRSS